MKGIFITYVEAGQDLTGVGKKIRNQIMVFNTWSKCQEIVMKISNSKFLRILYRLPFYNGYPKWEVSDEFKDIKYVYFRRPFIMTGFMRTVLKKIKKMNPDVKILLEIPTFPYDKEILHFRFSKILLLKDIYNRNKLKGLVDRIVTLTNDEKIFGIPTIQIVNGINLDEVRIRNPIQTEDNSIHLLAVAILKEWHGYDRLIRGLAEYYKKGGNRKIVFHIVGDGEVVNEYKKIITQNNLEEYVMLHGKLVGDALNQIYNRANLGVGSLGCHRIGIYLSSNLKSREYLAKGLPIITSTPIDIIERYSFPYCLKVSENESNIKIEDIIEFYDNKIANENINLLTEKIRSFASEACDINVTLMPIKTYLEGAFKVEKKKNY